MPAGQSRREREIFLSLKTSRGPGSPSIISVCLRHPPPAPLPPAPLTALFKFPAILCPPPHLPPPTLHLESGDVRAPNRVSAEVIDSSHRENSPAFSVSGAEPECWRVSETCKQSVAELSGRSQAHWREREGKRWNKSLFYWKGRSK